MIDVVVIRDPDASNEISVHGSEDVNIVDVDLGRDNLADEETFDVWATSLALAAEKLYHVKAKNEIRLAVLLAAENFGHDVPEWTRWDS